MYFRRILRKPRNRMLLVTLMLAPWLLLTSCIDDPAEHPDINEYQSYVELVWELYDQKYVGFDEKGVDWEAVGDQYREIAEGIDSYEELQETLIEMVGLLEDKNAFITPGDIPTFDPEIEVNVSESVLEELLEPYDYQVDSIYFAYGYCLIDSIAYFSILELGKFFPIMHFTDELKNYLDAPGMIIDLRISEGISLVPAEQIPGAFTIEEMTAFLTQHRIGPGHDDLSPILLHDVSPRTWAYHEPVVLLVGEQNLGSAEALASVLERLPHVTIIGDTTGGGGNIPGYFDQEYWPLWEDSIYWQITCPFSRVFTFDTTSIEGTGILPDIYVHTSPSDFLAGHDPVLEYAIEWIDEEISD